MNTLKQIAKNIFLSLMMFTALSGVQTVQAQQTELAITEHSKALYSDGKTEIEFCINKDAYVRVKIHEEVSRNSYQETALLADQEAPEGCYKTFWNKAPRVGRVYYSIDISNGNQSDKKTAWISEISNFPTSTCTGFKDLKAMHPFCSAIKWAKNNGIFNGYSDGTFRPNRPISRAEAIKVIFKSQNVAIDENRQVGPSFSDLDLTSWYAPYVEAAYLLDIVNGYDGNKFNPNQAITRAEALKILLETAHEVNDLKIPKKTYGQPYRDIEGADATRWYMSYAWFAQYNGLNYDPYYFNPNEFMTRAEMSDMLYRLSKVKQEKVD